MAVRPLYIADVAVRFAVNVFLRDGDKVYRAWHTAGRGTEQLRDTFALIDSPGVARLYGPK